MWNIDSNLIKKIEHKIFRTGCLEQNEKKNTNLTTTPEFLVILME